MAAMKRTPIFAVLLICFLLVGSEMTMRRVEGRICESPSRTFKGICVRNGNCASICQGEHFSDGKCEGVRRRCMCQKGC